MRQKNLKDKKVILNRILYFILILMIIIFLEDVFDILGIEMGYMGITILRIIILLAFLFYLLYKIKVKLSSGKNILVSYYGESNGFNGKINDIYEEDEPVDMDGNYGEHNPKMRSLDRKFASGEISEEEYIERVRKIKEKNR